VLHDEVIAVRDDNYFPSPTDPSHSSGGGGMSPNGVGGNGGVNVTGTLNACVDVCMCSFLLLASWRRASTISRVVLAVSGGGARLIVDFVNCELQNETCQIRCCFYLS
jgi:hypothetical protein